MKRVQISMLANFLMALAVKVKTAAGKLLFVRGALGRTGVDGRKQNYDGCNNHGIGRLKVSF